MSLDRAQNILFCAYYSICLVWVMARSLASLLVFLAFHEPLFQVTIMIACGVQGHEETSLRFLDRTYPQHVDPDNSDTDSSYGDERDINFGSNYVNPNDGYGQSSTNEMVKNLMAFNMLKQTYYQAKGILHQLSRLDANAVIEAEKEEKEEKKAAKEAREDAQNEKLLN